MNKDRKVDISRYIFNNNRNKIFVFSKIFFLQHGMWIKGQWERLPQEIMNFPPIRFLDIGISFLFVFFCLYLYLFVRNRQKLSKCCHEWSTLSQLYRYRKSCQNFKNWQKCQKMSKGYHQHIKYQSIFCCKIFVKCC